MPLVEARRIRKSLGRRLVLRNVDFTLETGERVVLVGANGSGKSTLLHVIAHVLDADEGEVSVDANFGFAPEKPDLPEHLLVGEWLDTIAALKGLGSSALEIDFGVEALRRKPLKALSLGQKQRVSLAAAWLGRPAFLILDEPTNALDSDTREAVIERICQTTALVATHDREVADRIATRLVDLDGASFR